MDRGTWQATVHGITKSWTWLKRISMHGYIRYLISKGRMTTVNTQDPWAKFKVLPKIFLYLPTLLGEGDWSILKGFLHSEFGSLDIHAISYHILLFFFCNLAVKSRGLKEVACISPDNNNLCSVLLTLHRRYMVSGSSSFNRVKISQ